MSCGQLLPALVTLTVLVGLFQVLLGLFRLDDFLRHCRGLSGFGPGGGGW